MVMACSRILPTDSDENRRPLACRHSVSWYGVRLCILKESIQAASQAGQVREKCRLCKQWFHSFKKMLCSEKDFWGNFRLIEHFLKPLKAKSQIFVMHYVEAYYQHNSIHIEIWQLWSSFSVSQSAWTPVIAALFLLMCSCNLQLRKP